MITPHPHERPLRAAVILISVLFWIGLLLLLWTIWDRYGTMLSFADVALLFGTAAIVAYISVALRKAVQAARLMGHAVEISLDQYPDLFSRVRSCAKRLSLADTHAAYLFQQPSHLLSYSLRYLGRDYIALNSELVGALTERQGAIDFYIGHELGRLHDLDRGFRWLLLPGRVVPLIGPAYARAKVYGYDRLGLAACKNRVDAAFALAIVAAGSRRWKSFSIAHYAEQSARSDAAFTLFELISAIPYLSRRIAHLRGVATGNGEQRRRHPMAWVMAALIPGIAPMNAFSTWRILMTLLWPAVIVAAIWHGHQQLITAGVVKPLPSRIDNQTVPINNTPAAVEPTAALAKEIPADAYTRLDTDLRRLGGIALNRQRKLGGVPCEVGNIAALDLNFRPGRYAFSCDEPIVYTVIESGEFEVGRAAHIRSFNWKENKVTTTLPTAEPAATSASPWPTVEAEPKPSTESPATPPP